MPIQKDGKTYYTLEEVSKRLDNTIEKEAENLLKRLQETKQRESQEKVYV